MDVCRIRFKNFRNLGVGKEGEGAWLDVGGLKQGGLICLIGANNAGKSNVLDGIIKINKGLEQTDRADFMDIGEVEPCVCLELICRELTKKTFVLSFIDKRALKVFKDILEEKKIDTQKVFEEPMKVIYGENETDKAIFLKTTDEIVFSCKCKRLEENQPSILGCFCVRKDEDDIKERITVLGNIKIAYETAENASDAKDLMEVLENHKPPNIVLKEPQSTKPISDQDCTVSYEQIKESTFFKTLFNILGKDLNSLLEDYRNYKDTNKRHYLDRQEENINKKLQEVAQQFNNMYAQEGLYNFKVKLHTDNLHFYFYKDGEMTFLDRQSTGFKKFFELFFSFLYQGKIGEGDLVLIDEPENSLSIPAQRELQSFLRDFGQKNGITFIVSTHSPFMLDTKHLDSIRLVVKHDKSKGAWIRNNFSSLDFGKVDALKKIVDALGFFEIDRKDQLIFVEGIMDYTILSAYQEIRKIKDKNSQEIKDTKSDFVFLPIGGVGDAEKGEIEKKSSNLPDFIKKMDLEKPPILLVDGDPAGDKAVESVKKELKAKWGSKSIPAFTLKDISEKFKRIESLFSQEDLMQFNLSDCKDNQVATMVSSAFKNTHNLKNKLSAKTKENLEAVFKFLESKADKTDNDDRGGVGYNGAS
ncbi:AAA family ATPase [Helicobacter suis]|uniref:AAA family ATPase n=1 Tax=Helicobacter suis TaxID=104628 RepID=UPI0013D6FD87|nr:AAA family ATPase [Helicobacter suis]